MRRRGALGWLLIVVGVFVGSGLTGALGDEYSGSEAVVGPGTTVDNTSAEFNMTSLERFIAKAYANDSVIRDYTGWQDFTWSNPAIWYNTTTQKRLGAVFRVTWATPVVFPVGFPIVGDVATGATSVPSQYQVTEVTGALIYVNITLGNYTVVGLAPSTPGQILRLPNGTPAPGVNLGGD